jgi:hypothetical protein
MSTTAKNWITTGAGAALLAALIYLTTNAPSSDSWATWRPVLLSALGAFLTGVYHSFQPQSGAAGVASADAVREVKDGKRDAGRGFSTVGALLSVALIGGILIFGAFVTGCTPTPNEQAVIVASENLAACVEAIYVHDENLTPPASPTQVVIDEGATCASQAEALLLAIGQAVNASSEATLIAKYHTDAVARVTPKGR